MINIPQTQITQSPVSPDLECNINTDAAQIAAAEMIFGKIQSAEPIIEPDHAVVKDLDNNPTFAV